MTELEKLAARVEREGASRELDAEIFALADPAAHARWLPEERKRQQLDDAAGMAVYLPAYSLPAYTSDLNTAMTLAGDEIRHIEWCNGRVEAAVFVPGTAELRYGYAHVDHPAAALCAAALRANQESRNEQG